jgi:hypothetical protein
MTYRGERNINQMGRDLQRDDALARLLAIGPIRAFSGLQAYAQERSWKPGWAAYAFKEIFGVWPGRIERAVSPAPLYGTAIECWVARRKKRQRNRLAKPAPPVT